MAITLSTAAKNAAADAVVDLVDAGSAAAQGTLQIRTASGGTLLVEIDLDNPAFGAAAAGVATLLGVPLTGTAVASGNAAWADVVDRDGTIVYSGTVTVTGGGGDFIIDTVAIQTNDTIQLNSHTVTAP